MEIQITQTELREMFNLQRNIAALTERLEEMKSNVKALLIGHIPVEPGRFDVTLVWRYMRNPAWKQIVIRELGSEFAEECRRNTPGHSICADVKVEEHAILPLWNQGNDDDEKDE